MRGQGSLEYVLLISGGILVAIIVVVGALQTPQTPIGSSEYGLANSYCLATLLDNCFGKTVPSGSNTYYCYLNDEGTACSAQPLGSPGCGPNQCDSGENCPADNVNCTNPGVCQRYPPQGVCISGCKYAGLAKGEQDPGRCDDETQYTGCTQLPCECDGVGHCSNKDCDNDWCEEGETCPAENDKCQTPPVCRTVGTCSGCDWPTPGCVQGSGCVYGNVPQGPETGRCDGTHQYGYCTTLPCECDGSGNCVHYDCHANPTCPTGEVCPADDPWCNQPPQHQTCKIGTCSGGTGPNGCQYNSFVNAGQQDAGFCDNNPHTGDCGSIPCVCNGIGTCIKGPKPLSQCTPSGGWENDRNYELTQDITSTGSCFDITANNVVLDCKGKTVTATNTVATIQGTNVLLKNCTLVSTNVSSSSAVQVLDTAANASIQNSTITNNSTDFAAVNAIAPGFTIQQSTINAPTYGIYVHDTESNTTIQNNTITVSGTSARGIWLSTLSFSSPGFSISNNTINLTSTSGNGHGINVSNVPGPGTIAQNPTITISAGANTGRGISVTASNNQITVNNNTISLSSTNSTTGSHGIYLSGNNNTISNNTVTVSSTGASAASRGIYITGTDNSVTDNAVSLTSPSTASHALYLHTGAYNTLVKNNNLCSGTRKTLQIASSDLQASGSNGNTCVANGCNHVCGTGGQVCIAGCGTSNCNNSC